MSDDPFAKYAPAADPFAKYAAPSQPAAEPAAAAPSNEPWFMERLLKGMSGGDVSRAGRIGMGMADPAVGIGQLAASGNLGLPMSRGLPQGVAGASDQAAQQREGRYQAGEKAAGLGGISSEWARVLGNLFSPTNLALGGAGVAAAPTSIPARIAMASGLGAIQGLTEPKPEGVTTGTVAKSAGLGAAGGAVGGAAGEVVGSLLGRAIATNTPQQIESAITQGYRSAVKPSRAGQNTAQQLGVQDWRILSAVDDVIANQPNLRYTDASGSVVSQGQLPRSLSQFAQALDQTKTRIFRQYDTMARDAGVQGVQIDLAPTITQLNQIAAEPRIVDFHPDLAAYATDLGNRMLARRFYTPSQAQDAIQDINRTLQGFYRNPSESSVARSAILAPVADTLRSGLDQAIAASPVGPGYAALKAQYGALRSAEKDVTAAAQRESNKIPGGVGGIATDVMASERVIHGIIHMDPTAIATATGLKAAKEWMRRANSPNAAISRIFSSRTQPPAGPVASGLRRALPIEGGLAGSDVANDRPLRPSIAGP